MNSHIELDLNSDEEDTLVLNDVDDIEEEEEEDIEDEDDEENINDDDEEKMDDDEQEDNDVSDNEGFNSDGEIDVSEIYDELPKNNGKNIFNKKRRNEPPPISKVKKTKKRKNVDYKRNIIENYREESIKMFKNVTTDKNSLILDKIIYKLVSERDCKMYNLNIKLEYVSLARTTISILGNKNKKVKCIEFVPQLKNAIFRRDWIIPDNWKNQKFIEDQITNNIENPPLPKAGVVKCPRCSNNPKLKDNPERGKKTEYFQKQTRSADEPMTNFCHCLECGYRWCM